jgi:monoterpene epsilon-lactone hydrolase
VGDTHVLRTHLYVETKGDHKGRPYRTAIHFVILVGLHLKGILMTQSAIESRLRSRLAISRFLPAYLPLPVIRWLEKLSARRVSAPSGITREVVSADGVPCEWLIPQNARNDQVLLYLHGGGFVFGISFLHREMVGYLARKMGIRVLIVDYRLAPEHPFPAALDDCVTAYRWLLNEGFSADGIGVAGDSAGGNLTITTLMKVRDSGDPLPVAAACLSPVADLMPKDKRLKEVHDPLLHPKSMRFFNTSYVAHNDPHNPLISPVFGDWQGLPPLLIHAGEDEILRDGAVRIDELARAAGVEVQLEIYPRMWHVWQLYLELPQAQQSLDDIAGFLKLHLADASRAIV